MRAEGGSRSTTRPWSSTGAPTTLMPRASNRRITGTYPGSSTGSQSPGSSRTRVTRSMACWVPQVTTTVSSVAATDRDRATQPTMARRSLIFPAGSPYTRLFGTDGGADLAAPLRSREQRGVRETRPEIESAAVRWRSEVRRPAREPGARPKGGRGARPLGRRRGCGCHHAAAASAPLGVALGHQAAVHGGHRVPGHAELACKLATGNELISGMQAARGNAVAELLVQLHGQRLPGSGVEEQVHPAGLPLAWYGQTMPSWISTADHLLP